MVAGLADRGLLRSPPTSEPDQICDDPADFPASIHAADCIRGIDDEERAVATVTNRDAVRAAERDARSTVGVRDVINLLRVEPRTRRTDAEINRGVLAALRRDSWLDDDSISAATASGVVTLTGEVDAAYEQSWADTLAGRVDGVTRVVNLLTVPTGRMFYYGVTTWLPADAIRDERIRQSIESQMMWSPFVDADEVHTTVNSGVATLTGKVDSWSERAAAVENAYEGGAFSVVDKLEIER